MEGIDFIAPTQDMDQENIQPADHDLNDQNGGNFNIQSGHKRRALSESAGAGPSRVGNNSSNNTHQIAANLYNVCNLTDVVYKEIQSNALACVQPAVSAIIKVDQQVMKAEKHLHKLMQQMESGEVSFKYLKLSVPELSYNCAEAQAEVAAAVQDCQLKMLAACVKGAEAHLAALKQEQLSIQLQAKLQMQQDSFGSLPDSWKLDPAVQLMQQQQQQLFDWELAKAKRNITNTQQQQAQKEAKKAAAAAAADVEAGATTLQEQVEQLVAKTVPKVLAAANAKAGASSSSAAGSNKATAATSSAHNSTGGKSNKGGSSSNSGGSNKGTSGKQQQPQGTTPPTPAPPAKPSYLEAAAGSSRQRGRSRSSSRSRSRFYDANQVPKGFNKQQQKHKSAAA